MANPIAGSRLPRTRSARKELWASQRGLVAQAFQPAVSPTFQSADRMNLQPALGFWRACRLENLRYSRLESPRYECSLTLPPERPTPDRAGCVGEWAKDARSGVV